MTDLSTLLPHLTAAGIDAAGVCAFGPDLLLPDAARMGSFRRLPLDAQSVIVCLFPYFTGLPPRRNLALYSMLPDYHTVAGAMLQGAADALAAQFPGRAFVPFVDVSPLDEVEAARRAGLGVRGQNGLLLADRFGPLTFVGALVTDLALTLSTPCGGCEACGACVAACPTGALTRDGFDPSRCRSAISQKKGLLTPWEAQQLTDGGLVWGCDLCTLACPHASGAAATPIAAFRADVEPLLTEDNLARLLQNRAFAWRGRAVLLRNLALLPPPAPGA